VYPLQVKLGTGEGPLWTIYSKLIDGLLGVGVGAGVGAGVGVGLGVGTGDGDGDGVGVDAKQVVQLLYIATGLLEFIVPTLPPYS
jgi:hypothetical protein